MSKKTAIDKLLEGREFRAMTALEARTAQENGEESYIVEGYATKFNEEYTLYEWSDYEVREKIDPGAFDGCDLSDVIMQYDHEGRVFARTGNDTLEAGPDNIGLHIKADLGGTNAGRELHSEIKGGYTTKMSFSMKVAEDQRLITEDRETGKVTVLRTITKIGKVYDVSAVSLPANDATEISARSFGDGLITEVRAERLKAEERAHKLKALRLRTRLWGEKTSEKE